ncbi:hypothetical protein BDV06DRAFT_201089 [Aspergillus oleicola]
MGISGESTRRTAIGKSSLGMLSNQERSDCPPKKFRAALPRVNEAERATGENKISIPRHDRRSCLTWKKEKGEKGWGEEIRLGGGEEEEEEKCRVSGRRGPERSRRRGCDGKSGKVSVLGVGRLGGERRGGPEGRSESGYYYDYYGYYYF